MKNLNTIFNSIDNWVEYNKNKIIDFLSKIVSISTENIPPHGNELNGQEFLVNFVKKEMPDAEIDLYNIMEVNNLFEHELFYKYSVNELRVYNNRPNLMVRLKGSPKNNSIVFSNHIDTAPRHPLPWKISSPFSGEIKNSKLYGRGSADMKGGLVSSLFSLLCIYKLGIIPNGDIYFESIIDEEFGGGNGTLASRLRYPDIDLGIIPEPNNMILSTETMGGAEWLIKVKTLTNAGYSFSDENIVNPIDTLADIVKILQQYNDFRNKRVVIPENFPSNTLLPLDITQICAGGCTYKDQGGIPKEGHLYLWLQFFSDITEKAHNKEFKAFIKNKLKNIYGDDYIKQKIS